MIQMIGRYLGQGETYRRIVGEDDTSVITAWYPLQASDLVDARLQELGREAHWKAGVMTRRSARIKIVLRIRMVFVFWGTWTIERAHT